MYRCFLLFNSTNLFSCVESVSNLSKITPMKLNLKKKTRAKTIEHFVFKKPRKLIGEIHKTQWSWFCMNNSHTFIFRGSVGALWFFIKLAASWQSKLPWIHIELEQTCAFTAIFNKFIKLNISKVCQLWKKTPSYPARLLYCLFD